MPKPTPEAIAQNKKEIASRGQAGRFGRMKGSLRKHPDLRSATTFGQPTLVDPKATGADQIVRNLGDSMKSGSAPQGGGSSQVKVEPVSGGAQPAANQPVPHSDTGTNPQDKPAQPPAQVNEAASGGSGTTASGNSTSTGNTDQGTSTSKKKKKKFLIF